MIPRLHLVTDDEVVARPTFPGLARSVLEAMGPLGALHLRGPHATGRHLFELAEALRDDARRAHALLLVNDRVDVALALGLDGVHLGQRSLPPAVARRLLGPGGRVGLSVHGASEARAVLRGVVDFLVAGPIFPTASHPGVAGGGVERIREVRAAHSAPVLAIGGIEPGTAGAVLEAGAYGLAVRSGVWDRDDPPDAVRSLLRVLEDFRLPGGPIPLGRGPEGVGDRGGAGSLEGS